jgi:inner membrane protein
MENLTHTLVGLMMARCGLEKTTVRGAGMMMLAANAPDVDAVFWFNRLHYLDYHRSYTHSFACAPLVALLPMALARAQFSWKSYASAIAGVLSHLLLDFTNPYGIQLLLPFSHRRLMLDITNIADLWIWTILFIGLLAPWFGKTFGKMLAKMLDRGAGAIRSPRARWAGIALVALVTYEGGRFAMHEKAVEMLASRTFRGAAPTQVIAVPADFIHPARWKGIARSPGYVTIVPLNVQDGYDASQELTYEDSAPGDVIAAARRLPEFQTMIRFSQAPFWKATPVAGGTLVELMDLRYGTPDDPGFAAISGVLPAIRR